MGKGKSAKNAVVEEIISNNAYVAVINKKLRNVNKKLDKIAAIEKNIAEGKVNVASLNHIL